MDSISRRKVNKQINRSNSFSKKVVSKPLIKKKVNRPFERDFEIKKKPVYTYSNTKKNNFSRSSFAPKKIKKSQNEDKSKSFFIIAIIIFITSILLLFAFLTLKTATDFTNNITNDSINKSNANEMNEESNDSFLSTLSKLAKTGDETTLDGYSDGRINILLLGIAGTQKPGATLTDTIMLASIDTKKHAVSLLSLPRDLLVSYNNSYVKINSVYSRGINRGTGIQDIKNIVNEITGQKINYHIVLDFQGFIDVIDALGGINIDVPRNINDTKYPGPGYSYETFKIDKGLQHLDGATALKYARTRHEDPESDFGRAKRQQQVLRAARNKAFTLGTIANPFKINDLINAIGNHVTMNIKPSEITSFIALINNLDTQNITTFVVDAWKKDSLLISARIGNLPGLLPRSGTWDEIQEISNNIFSIEKIKKRKTQISVENSSILIVNFDSSLVTNNLIKHLNGRGFSDIKIIKANKNTQAPATTIILDKSNGKYLTSLDELIVQLNAKLQNNLPDNLKDEKELKDKLDNPDFIIVLGKDTSKSYDYINLTKEEFDDLGKEK